MKFYYDHGTHWITDNRGTAIVTAPGSFQSELGCPGDWQPDCLRSWLQDPDGDGVFTFTTRGLPAGAYEVKVAINESWDENYGEGGVRNGPNIPFTVSQSCEEVVFTYVAATHVLTVGTAVTIPGNLARARAHWVCEDTIAWNPAGNAASAGFALHYAPEGGLTLGPDGVAGGQRIPLTRDPAGLSRRGARAVPAPRRLPAALRLPADRLAEVPAVLKGQLAVSAADAGGTALDATSVQIPGVLDDLFAYDGPLGVSWTDGVPTLRVWAPTARSVTLHLFPRLAAGDHVHHAADAARAGHRSLEPDPDGAVDEPLLPLRGRGLRPVHRARRAQPGDRPLFAQPRPRQRAVSQIVDLGDPRLAPPGWDRLDKPRLRAPQDISLYELHVRDFSARGPRRSPKRCAARSRPSRSAAREACGTCAASRTRGSRTCTSCPPSTSPRCRKTARSGSTPATSPATRPTPSSSRRR